MLTLLAEKRKRKRIGEGNFFSEQFCVEDPNIRISLYIISTVIYIHSYL